MKTYNAKKRISKQLKKAIIQVIDTNNEYKACYFWNQTWAASQRRSQESRFERENPEFKINTEKGSIVVTPDLRISCKNFYYSLSIERGDNKSNISILKNMINYEN